MREIVSAPPQKAPLPVSTVRPALRDHGAAPGAAPPVPFEFGALAVRDPLAPGALPAGPQPAAAPPREPAAKAEVKPKSAAPPARPQQIPGVHAEPPAPARRVATPASPSAVAAAPAAPRVEPEQRPAPPALRAPREHPAATAGGHAPPGKERVAGTAHPELAKVAPASAAPWLRVFQGLRRVAEALLARVLASRSEPSPATSPTRPREGAAGQDTHPADDWAGRVEGLVVAAAEIRSWSAAAGEAAGAARTRPDAAAAAPFGPEAARIGQGARIVGAELAIARAARTVRRRGDSVQAHAFGERMALRWAALEPLLARVRGGEGSVGPAVEADASAAHGDADAFRSEPAAGLDLSKEPGVTALFGASAAIGEALDEAPRRMGKAAATDDAAAPVEARLAAAAAWAEQAVEAPLPALPPQPEHARDDERRAREARLPPERRERPATWELRIATTSTEVGVEDVARTLGLSRIADLRDVLAEGLSTRHQFVLWTQVGTRLSAALQALVDAGLVETRIQPRG